jgi:hypothetical protein
MPYLEEERAGAVDLAGEKSRTWPADDWNFAMTPPLGANVFMLRAETLQATSLRKCPILKGEIVRGAKNKGQCFSALALTI